MKIDRNTFLAALKTVSISSNAVGAAMEFRCVEISTIPNGIALQTTDCDTETRVTVPCSDVATLDGPAVVECTRFMSVIGGMPSGEIDIRFDGATIVARNASVKATVMKTDLPMPHMPEIKSKESFTVGVAEFVRMIGLVERSVAGKNESRHILKGISLEKCGGKLTAVGCDGRRCSRVKANVSAIGGAVILPVEYMRKLVKVLAAHEDKGIIVRMNDNAAEFVVGDGVIRTRTKLVSGAYPNIDVLFNRGERVATVGRTDFVEALRRSLVVNTTGECRSVDLEIGGRTIALSSGDGRDRMDMVIPAETDLGDSESIIINPDYLIDALEVLITDRVTLFYHDCGSPVIILSEVDNCECVIMPLRVS